MPDKSFEDIQTDRAERMQSSPGQERMAQVAQNLQESAQQEAVNTSQLSQNVRRVEQQISNLTSNVQQLTAQKQMQQADESVEEHTTPTSGGIMPSMPDVDPYIDSAYDTTKSIGQAGLQGAVAGGEVASMAGGMAKQGIHQTVGTFAQGNQQPGHLRTSEGILRGMSQSTGLFYSPDQANDYSYGAYQRSQARASGEGARNLVEGSARSSIALGGTAASALGVAGSYIGARSLGGVAGNFIGGPIGGVIGATAGSMLDAVNPVSYSLDQVSQQATFGAAAGQTAHRFLRGQGGGMGAGNMSLTQQSRAGQGVFQETYKDLTYNTQELASLQGDFAQSGAMRGVRTADEYTKRFKKLIDAHRNITKSLHLSHKEAVQYMEEMNRSIGVNPGNAGQMGRMTTQMYASAHLRGVSSGEMMQVASQGAQGGIQAGYMGTGGAEAAMTGASMAGTAATLGLRSGDQRGVDQELLASVGGEQGLSQLIQKSLHQFIGGRFGTIMAAGGGLNQRPQRMLSQAGQNIQTGTELVNFVANRHRRKNELIEGQGDLAAGNQAAMVYRLAKRISPSGEGKALQSTMQQLTQKMGFAQGPKEAEALVESYKTLPEDIKRQRQVKAQKRNDAYMDRAQEQYGVVGQTKRTLRETMYKPFMPYATEISEDTAEFGDQVAYTSRNIGDSIIGAISGTSITRTNLTRPQAKKIREDLADYEVAPSKEEVRQKLGDDAFQRMQHELDLVPRSSFIEGVTTGAGREFTKRRVGKARHHPGDKYFTDYSQGVRKYIRHESSLNRDTQPNANAKLRVKAKQYGLDIDAGNTRYTRVAAGAIESGYIEDQVYGEGRSRKDVLQEVRDYAEAEGDKKSGGSYATGAKDPSHLPFESLGRERAYHISEGYHQQRTMMGAEQIEDRYFEQINQDMFGGVDGGEIFGSDVGGGLSAQDSVQVAASDRVKSMHEALSKYQDVRQKIASGKMSKDSKQLQKAKRRAQAAVTQIRKHGSDSEKEFTQEFVEPFGDGFQLNLANASADSKRLGFDPTKSDMHVIAEDHQRKTMATEAATKGFKNIIGKGFEKSDIAAPSDGRLDKKMAMAEAGVALRTLAGDYRRSGRSGIQDDLSKDMMQNRNVVSMIRDVSKGDTLETTQSQRRKMLEAIVRENADVARTGKSVGGPSIDEDVTGIADKFADTQVEANERIINVLNELVSRIEE